MYLIILCYFVIINSLRFTIVITTSLEGDSGLVEGSDMNILTEDEVAFLYDDISGSDFLSTVFEDSNFENDNKAEDIVASENEVDSSNRTNDVETNSNKQKQECSADGTDFQEDESCNLSMTREIVEGEETNKCAEDSVVMINEEDTRLSKSVNNEETSLQLKDSNVESEKESVDIKSVPPSTSQTPNPIVNGATENTFTESRNEKIHPYDGFTSENFIEEVQRFSNHLPDPTLLRKMYLEQEGSCFRFMESFYSENFLEKEIISDYFTPISPNNNTDQDNELLQYKIKFSLFFKIEVSGESIEVYKKKSDLLKSLIINIQVLTFLFKTYPSIIACLIENNKIFSKPEVEKLVSYFFHFYKTTTQKFKNGEINKEEHQNFKIARSIIKGLNKTLLETFYNFLNFTKLLLGACRVHEYENEADEREKENLIRDYIDRNLVEFDETDEEYYYLISWINLKSSEIKENIKKSKEGKKDENPNPRKKQRTN